MRFKRPIYRILFFAAWILLFAGIATLVVAANGKTDSRTCKGVAVSVNADAGKLFVEKGDVLKAIERTAGGRVEKKRFSAINLGAMERSLEANPWVRDAELYFDTRDVLHVSVWERQPFARVFTTAGTSFYIDSSGYRLPLLADFSVKLPVVTGFTAEKKLGGRDSATLQGIKAIVGTINADPFWTAQIGQIDITPQRKFELVPLIGSHIIRLGYANDAAEVKRKLQNLMVFYRQVLHKAGLAKYSALDVQFEGQVVAERKGPTSRVDSLQLQKNIEELLKKKAAEQEPEDAAQAVQPKAPMTEVTKTDSAHAESTIQNSPATQQAADPSPAPKRTVPKLSNPAEKPIRKPSPQKSNEPNKKPATQKPKAVMPARVQNDY